MGGLATYGKQLAFEGALPNDTEFFVGLLTTVPTDDAGTGLVEATGSGYARIGHSTWLSIVDSSEWYRVNKDAVELAVLTSDLTGILGWGIWTLGAGGSLVAWGSLVDVDSNSVTRTYKSGDQPRFISQEIRVGVG